MQSNSLAEELRPFVWRFAWAATYLIAVILIGTAGFYAIEEWPLFDCLYMSVTTVTSVGFMEVHPLSNDGRTLAMVLVGFGLTGLGIWWGLITALIVELDLGGWLRSRRVMEKVSRMKNHFIVCGGGRMGRVVMAEMRRSGRQFVLVENNAERVAFHAGEHPDLPILDADATLEQHSGAGRHRPGGGARRLPRRGRRQPSPGSHLAGSTLLEARIPQRTGLIVLAVRKGGMTGKAFYNPGPETKLDPGDVLIVLGRLEQIDGLRRDANEAVDHS